MQVFQPIVNCGLDAGNLPANFMLEFSKDHCFRNEANCNAWITDNCDNFTWREMGGGVYAASQDVKNPVFID